MSRGRVLASRGRTNDNVAQFVYGGLVGQLFREFTEDPKRLRRVLAYCKGIEFDVGDLVEFLLSSPADETATQRFVRYLKQMRQ
jgi:hypothetical protein